MENEPFKKYNLIRQTISRDQIVDFVNELHRVQHDMIEMLVASKERQGFPEATTLIKHIQGLR
jgi:DNA helicase IV